MICVLEERRHSVAAVPVLNPVNMCHVEHIPKHSGAYGCTNVLRVEKSNTERAAGDRARRRHI